MAELDSAENNLEVVHLVQELVTGAVLPHLGQPDPRGPESALTPSAMTSLELERVSRAELLDAVKGEVERCGRASGRDLVAQEVTAAGAAL